MSEFNSIFQTISDIPMTTRQTTKANFLSKYLAF